MMSTTLTLRGVRSWVATPCLGKVGHLWHGFKVLRLSPAICLLEVYFSLSSPAHGTGRSRWRKNFSSPAPVSSVREKAKSEKYSSHK
jgi:hypothetical protein